MQWALAQESLRRALEGAWGVFAVHNTWEAGVEREEAHSTVLQMIAVADIGVQPTRLEDWPARTERA